MFRNEAVKTHTHTIYLRKAHHNIYPSSDLLLTSWRPLLSVFKVVWNFLIKYQDDYLWWNIKYFSPGQRAISSKRHNSPFFGLLKPRWLFIFVMHSDPRSLFTLCFTSLQSPKHHCNCFSHFEIRPFFPLNLGDIKHLLTPTQVCICQHTQNTSFYNHLPCIGYMDVLWWIYSLLPGVS